MNASVRRASVVVIGCLLGCDASAGSRKDGGDGEAGVGGIAGSESGGSAGSVAAPAAAAAGGGAGGAGAGGMTSGGMGGVAMSGAAGGMPSDWCAPRPGLIHCETFETHTPGAAQPTGAWSPSVNGDGTVEIDTVAAHGGERSLKVHGSGFSTFLVLDLASLGASAGALHVRSFVRLAEPMTAGHNTFIIADTKQAPGAGNAFRLGEMNEMLMYTVSGDTHGALANESYYTDHMPGAALRPAAWSCLEFELDTFSSEITVTLDGKDIADLHHRDWPLDAYDTLRFGFEKYAGPVSDVWFDDIAIASAPIGCE